MNSFTTFRYVILAFIVLLSVSSCSKEDMDSKGHLTGVNVKLKSTAGLLDKVYVDIADVQLQVKENADAPNAWRSLNAISGTHNVSDLRDGVELVLVESAAVESTFIYAIRLVLGDNNFIDYNHVLYSLDVTTIGNAAPSNLVRSEFISDGFYDIVIDIDIDNSVRYDQEESLIILDPKLYTEIRKIKY